MAEKVLAVLNGQASTVAASIRRMATCCRLEPGKRVKADTCADYLLAKRPYLDYPTALAKGWPIATGVIEGACRHLVKDRMVFSSGGPVRSRPRRRQTVLVGYSSASYRHPRVRVPVVASQRAFRVELPDGRAYWSVVDDGYTKVAVADRFLFDLRFGRDRAESTTRVYAGELARFLSWCDRTERSLANGAVDLSHFVLVSRSTPTERPGAGQGRPPGPARINHVLTVVREFYKHAVAAGLVDGSALAALYEVADDRFLPAELRAEDG